MAREEPDLSKERLARVLALTRNASPQQIASTAPRLLDRLRERLEHASEDEAPALRLEIERLESSLSAISKRPATLDPTDLAERLRLEKIGALLGVGFALVLLIAYAAGYRITRVGDTEPAPYEVADAELILDGRLPGATLRVLDPDREELLFKVPAEGARLALGEGRYALEVSREDCPDQWTRSVYFEAGQSRRFEPTLCVGEGELVVRSNVVGDRLTIDGLDVGPTGEKAHLVGVGDHDVRIEKAGFAPFEGKVRIRPDESLELRAELIPADAAGPVGRPMPVAKVEPATAPGGGGQPGGLDLSGLREEIEGGTQGMEVVNPELDFDDISTSVRTDGGSTVWHDRVSADMLARYDLDGSGRIDRLEESEAIPCNVWVEIERDFDGGGLGLTMARYYGFDGSEWHPGALGFARAHRSAVFERMKECGLRS